MFHRIFTTTYIFLFVTQFVLAQDILPNQPKILYHSDSKESSENNNLEEKETKDYIEQSWFGDNNGYEWTNEIDKMKLVEKTYPVNETYYIHPEHNDLKVHVGGSLNEPYYITRGSELVHVLFDQDKIHEILWPAILRYAYRNNIYNIKKENSNVQQWIKMNAKIIKSNLSVLKTKTYFKDATIVADYEKQIQLDCDIKAEYDDYSFEREHKTDNEILYTTPNKSVAILIKYSLVNGKIKKDINIIKVPWK